LINFIVCSDVVDRNSSLTLAQQPRYKPHKHVYLNVKKKRRRSKETK